MLCTYLPPIKIELHSGAILITNCPNDLFRVLQERWKDNGIHSSNGATIEDPYYDSPPTLTGQDDHLPSASLSMTGLEGPSTVEPVYTVLTDGRLTLRSMMAVVKEGMWNLFLGDEERGVVVRVLLSGECLLGKEGEEIFLFGLVTVSSWSRLLLVLSENMSSRGLLSSPLSLLNGS